jgi:hypothetical protein
MVKVRAGYLLLGRDKNVEFAGVWHLLMPDTLPSTCRGHAPITADDVCGGDYVYTPYELPVHTYNVYFNPFVVAGGRRPAPWTVLVYRYKYGEIYRKYSACMVF